jgi:hypothetical protein
MNIGKLTLVFGVCSGSLFASAFQNGSFENPGIPFGPDFATVPTGWVKVDPTGAGLFLQLNTSFGIPIDAGPQSYGFGGNGATTGSLSQTFDTVSGTSYLVNFDYIVQQGLEQESLNVAALNGATTLASNTITFSGTVWTAAPTLVFVATGPSTTLRFSDNTGAALPGVGGGTNWALDAVTVAVGTAPNGAAPEPASFALVGLGALAALWRRRALRV